MWDPHEMNRQDGLALSGDSDWEGREEVLVEQAAQMWRDGLRAPMPERLDRTDATNAEKASILRKLAG